MIPVALFSVLALCAIGWMLYTNARDRKTFEKQLERALQDDHDGDAKHSPIRRRTGAVETLIDRHAVLLVCVCLGGESLV